MSEYPRLEKVEPIEDFKLLLYYGNQERRIYDFKPHLTHRYFASLAGKETFSRVFVHNGDIEWESGQDFCPHTLYEKSVSVV